MQKRHLPQVTVQLKAAHLRHLKRMAKELTRTSGEKISASSVLRGIMDRELERNNKQVA